MTRRVWAVVIASGLVHVGCGSSESRPGASGASAGSGTTAGSNSGGNAAAGQSGGGSGGAGTAGVAGTGGNGGAAPPACMAHATNQVAGTRLKYRVIRTAEGDEAYDGFYDATTGEDCTEGRASDGKLRCLPARTNSVTGYYADANCSGDSLYAQLADCPAPYLVDYDSTDPCATREQIYSVGETYQGAVFQRGPDGCAAIPSGNVTYVRKGALVDPTRFVELEGGQLPDAGRVVRTGYRSADGAFKVTGYYDKTFETSCDFFHLRDGKEHCIARFGSIGDFADAACTTDLVSSDLACGATPAQYFARTVPDPDVCKSGTAVFKADQAVTGPTYRRESNGGECTPKVADGSSTVQYSTLTAVPDSAMPEISYTTLESDPGRLKPRYRTAADGSCSFADFWDSELGLECYFSGDPVNGYYCYPDSQVGRGDQAFSDPACLTPVTYFAFLTCAADRIAKYALHSAPTSCGKESMTLHKLEPAGVGTAAKFFNDSSGECLPFATNASNTYFVLGAEVPTSALVRGDRVAP